MRAIIMHLADTPLCLIFSHSGPIKGECPEGHWAFDRHISITESHISLSQFRKIYESQSAFDLHAMALAQILHRRHAVPRLCLSLSGFPVPLSHLFRLDSPDFKYVKKFSGDPLY